IDAAIANVGDESLGLRATAGAKVQNDRCARVAEADVARQGPGRPGLVQHRVQGRCPESTESIPVTFLEIRCRLWVAHDRHWSLRAFGRLEEARCREPGRRDMVDRLFKEDQTSVLDAWIAGVEDLPNGWVAARWTWARGKRGVGEGDARGREPGALIEGI